MVPLGWGQDLSSATDTQQERATLVPAKALSCSCTKMFLQQGVGKKGRVMSKQLKNIEKRKIPDYFHKRNSLF